MPHDLDSIIGELAVKRGYITQAQLNEMTRRRASAHPGIPLAQALVKQGLISEPDLANLLREHEEALRETTRPGRATERADSGETIRATDSSGRGPVPQADPGPQRSEGVPFGHYLLLQELGRGAMGKVFKACDTKLNRVVALKQILLEDPGEHELIARFMREARVAARLKHPNIVSVHDVGEVDGKHYFTMDYIEGQSLSVLFECARAGSLLPGVDKAATAGTGERPSSSQAATQLADSTGTVLESPARDSSTATKLGTEAKSPDSYGLSMRKGLELIRDIAGALHHAHEAGVVHRDIKPGNVLVDRTGRPYITDFGLAKDISVRDTSRLTHSGALMGTPVYMSPEQAAGKVHMIGPHSD
ncbi:MAG: protein kinase, partial [Planctomycetota bacterium]|nr:protein kinase [Planctomycetota bacterium]